MKIINRREMLRNSGIIAGISIISGCAMNPVTGKAEFMLMSEDAEISLGKKSHSEIVSEYGTYQNSDMQKWLTDRGGEMAKITQRKNLAWQFTLLDSPVINAFAVPGGYVYITRGIMGYFNNEAEFAGVLAHEMGHVNARHSAKQYSKAKLASIGLVVGSLISEDFRKYSVLVSAGASLMFLKFSRDDEREADRLGVQYSSVLGYDAVNMSNFFKTLERLSPKDGSLPAWTSTHPDPGERVKNVRTMALAYQKKNPQVKYLSKRNEYLEKIDGLVFGDDPRQGYVKNGMFIHPEMKFMFPVPSGWKLTNQPTEVRFSPEDQKSILVFNVANGNDPTDASTKFSSANSVTVSGNKTITVNGMNALKTQGTISSSSGTMGIESVYIMAEKKVYAFHGLAASNEIGTYSGTFEKTFSGFNKVSDKTLLSVAPEKIKLRKVTSKSTLRKAFNTFSVPEKDIEKLSIINGLLPDDIVETGTYIKVIA